MSVNKVFKATSPVAMAILLASCGAGTTDSGSGAGVEPEAGAANEVIDPTAGNSGTGTTISGRVADGYIQGATVCVDLNNSDSCDDNEPSALTGPGGSYDLEIPAGAEDKPIVADIPAEAIDEDTGEAIGKSLVFIAPADEPEFISPITTLVHQELQSDPTLNIKDAEIAVKALLGVGEQDVSLFTDYVAGGRDDNVEGDAERQNNFRYLHDTARVVTSMMKDIESEVESAAQSNGIDVLGNTDTQRAIRDIVRREVRELLPAIARQVADLVGAVAEESDSAEPNASADVDTEFDPDKIALALRPDDVRKDVQERIDAVVDRIEPVAADLKQALTDGVYWMEFDCYYEEPVDYPVDAEPLPVPATFEDDVDMEEEVRFEGDMMPNCAPFYGKVQLNAAGDEVTSKGYGFDVESGSWVEEFDEEDTHSEFVLIDGQWQELASSDSGPEGKVEFMADGSAIITSAEGTMQLKAVTQGLDAVEVKKHVLSEAVDPAWLDLVESSDIFSADSLAHMISVKQTLHPYVLFNEKPYADMGGSMCAEYYDNCNVIGDASSEPFYALQTLNEVREGAIQGMELVSMHPGMGYGANMKIIMDGEFDGTLPSSGSVEWSFGYSYHHEAPHHVPAGEYVDPSTGETYPAPAMPIDSMPIDECYMPGSQEGDYDPSVLDPFVLPEGDVDIPVTEGLEFPVDPDDLRPLEVLNPDGTLTYKEEYDEEIFNEIPPELYPLPAIDGCADLASQAGEYDYLEPYQPVDQPTMDEKPVLSRWKLVEVDGVELIEIQLPTMFRFDDDASNGALLLAEHNGYVRQGVRMAESFIDRVATYNETAFTTLRAIIERHLFNR
ncbi:MAG: hypothetical protein AB8B87_09805 [Granulosicoccus sp.]